jgi:hypothetical protein
MPKLRITNLTNSPFDLDGGFRLPAMGRIVGDFSEAYAAAISASPGVAVQAIAPLDHDGDGKSGGSLPGPASTRAKGRRGRPRKA